MSVCVASLLAERRAKEMPCTCQLQGDRQGLPCTVLASTRRRGIEIEQLVCACGERFKRIWVKD